ncbi:MAG: ABC transporter ATP-binding protein [Bdellovibrionaceae bacterium]|nr:ABC transporter ATP-binding protein [Pseudobdellovibrionaceae bacterium]MDW8190222.1 ABC transporter ATP-binding protein [Pseudobdellovibrionaceae bacterium]
MDVEFVNIQKSFGNQVVVDGLSLKIDSGEFVVLLGPSGCGKSTLLRILSGLEIPDAGDVLVGKKRVNDIKPSQRKIAMVFQNYSLYPHMTVFDNLSFSLRLSQIPVTEIKKKVHRVAELLRIEQLLERYPKQLSGGQRQRVALGRALIRETPVVLFDEPLSNLDAHLRSTMRAEIKNLHENLKNTVIYVTHDQVEAMTLGHRIAVMHHGRVIQVDDPLTIYRKPQNIFVARFIGSPEINILHLNHMPHIQIPEEWRSRLPSPLLGIRPEDMRAYPKQGMKKIGEGYLTFIENLGSHFLYHIEVDQKIIRTYETPKEFLRTGEKVEIFAQLEKIMAFHPDTELLMS